MKRILPLMVGWLFAVTWAFAAPTSSPSVLVSSDTMGEIEKNTTVYSGNVKVQFNGSSAMVVRAQTMTYDFRERRMIFKGEVEITGVGPTVRSKELSLDFGAAGVNLYLLNEAGIVGHKVPVSTAPPSSGPKAPSAPEETRKP